MASLLYAASASIRPRRYLDDDNSRDRAGVYGFFMLIFAGVIIGLAIYQSQNRTSKQIKLDNPTYNQVLDLYDRYYNDEIQNLDCDCKHAYNNMPVLNTTQNGYCEFYINDTGTALPYIGLCNNLDEAILSQYYGQQISAPSLMDISELTDSIYLAYVDACILLIANQLTNAENLVVYFQSFGIGNATAYAEMVGFWNILFDQALNYTSLLCSLDNPYGAVDSVPPVFYCDGGVQLKYQIPNITNYWDDYFCVCQPKACQYSQPQSDFDVFLILVSYIGTIFGVIMASAAILYGLLFSTYYAENQKKERRRRRAQEVHDMELALGQQQDKLLDEDDSSSVHDTKIRDDATDFEEDSKEGAYSPDKCFVTSCKEKPANKTMFCVRHGGLTKPDEPQAT